MALWAYSQVDRVLIHTAPTIEKAYRVYEKLEEHGEWDDDYHVVFTGATTSVWFLDMDCWQEMTDDMVDSFRNTRTSTSMGGRIFV